MLEDESGRIRLVGDYIRDAVLVTGVVIAALGIETPNGDFEVVDICCAGMAPHSNPNSCEYLEDAIFLMDVGGMHRLSTATFRH
jgi:DNA polymerase delta subunit 2